MTADRKRGGSASGAVTAAALEDKAAGKSSRNWYGNNAVSAASFEDCSTGSLLRYGAGKGATRGKDGFPKIPKIFGLLRGDRGRGSR